MCRARSTLSTLPSPCQAANEAITMERQTLKWLKNVHPKTKALPLRLNQPRSRPFRSVLRA